MECYYLCKPSRLDPLQFTYCQNRNLEDANSTALHSALSHLDNSNTCVRMLFSDFCSAFSTIIPSKLMTKLSYLGINTSLCNWILDFLTNRSQSVNLDSLHLQPSPSTRRAQSIVTDASHPSHRLFALLPCGRHYRTLRSRTSRLRNSFFPSAVTLLKSAPR